MAHVSCFTTELYDFISRLNIAKKKEKKQIFLYTIGMVPFISNMGCFCCPRKIISTHFFGSSISGDLEI